MRQISADSKYLGEIFSELLRQAWCFATNQEMKGCECRKGHKKSPPLRAIPTATLIRRVSSRNSLFFLFLLEKCLLFSKKSLTLQGKNNFCVRKNFFNIY